VRELAFVLSLATLLPACARVEPRPVTIRVVVDPDAAIDVNEIVVSPAKALVGKRLDGTNVTLSLRPGGAVTLRAPFACPVVVDLAQNTATVRLMPLFDVGPARRVVGFHRGFELAATPACDDARGAAVTLSVAGGAPLAAVQILDGGARLAGRTALPAVLSPGISAGIVPVSDAERGATRVDVATRLPDGHVRHRFIELAASSRASGLANVALQHPVLLRGQNLRLTERPPDSRAELRPVGELLELIPDVPGRFVLEGGVHARTVVDSGRYDETPLDCGRADCHRSIAESALTSPMTHAYARDLEGPRAFTDPSCALACHTTGEPGLDDGGFTHVARELGNPTAHGFAELPRGLRRLGGVGCLACHGPGAIPEPTSRFAVLGRGVCAVCHDSPPTYGHVAAFASTRMASADRDARTHEQSCARCHTTFGALGRLGHRPPPGVALGLGCATCHDVHPSSPGARVTSSLLRGLPLPETLGALPASMLGPSRVCVSCHAPSSGTMLPEASAAALVLGRGGTEPLAGTPVVGAAPHGTALDGCLSCHRSGPEGLGRGASHAFAVAADACARCHTARLRDPSLADRARALFQRLGRSHPASPSPPHALAVRPPADPALARAFANVVLVLEDPAADVHNPRYAAQLLDHAEAALTQRSPTSQAP
jgi:hypothetical protein